MSLYGHSLALGDFMPLIFHVASASRMGGVVELNGLMMAGNELHAWTPRQWQPAAASEKPENPWNGRHRLVKDIAYAEHYLPFSCGRDQNFPGKVQPIGRRVRPAVHAMRSPLAQRPPASHRGDQLRSSRKK